MHPPLFENMCVRSLGYIVGASPPLCVHSIANTVSASPPRVCPFIGRQSSLDPWMLPTPLCGIFFIFVSTGTTELSRTSIQVLRRVVEYKYLMETNVPYEYFVWYLNFQTKNVPIIPGKFCQYMKHNIFLACLLPIYTYWVELYHKSRVL